MPDFAVSHHAGVQAQLDRLARLSPGADILGLERITALLSRLGDPHRRLPPVFHVAGTNGKGSTCAYLRAVIEAAGLKAHVYTSPHLVRFNERIRLAGQLVEDSRLAALLAEVLDVADGIGASFFEVTTAAAFLAFSRERADACIVEVGLGGRLDATNVVTPAVTGIAQLGIDHQAFLGDTIEAIAGEKAGIAKPGVPLITMRYAEPVAARIAEVATAANAAVLAEGKAWRFETADQGLIYTDRVGTLSLPLPAMVGQHQVGNYALAIALLRHQTAIKVPEEALATAATRARWPARMQRLSPGPLIRMAPPGATIWLDGGHNAAAGDVLAKAFAEVSATRFGSALPRHLILGMLANKDPAGLLEPLAPLLASVTAVPVPGHDHHAPTDLARLAHHFGVAATATAADVPEAVAAMAASTNPHALPPVLLITGSLYLAGEVLRLNNEPPT